MLLIVDFYSKCWGVRRKIFALRNLATAKVFLRSHPGFSGKSFWPISKNVSFSAKDCEASQSIRTVLTLQMAAMDDSHSQPSSTETIHTKTLNDALVDRQTIHFWYTMVYTTAREGHANGPQQDPALARVPNEFWTSATKTARDIRPS